MLVYGPTADTPALNCYAETTPGFTITVWDEATWAAATTADFSAFDVIVFGNCPPFGDTLALWATATANNAVWGPAITGNIVIIGTDPDNHIFQSTAPIGFVHQMVNFAADDPDPGPGLYLAIGHIYDSPSPSQPVDLLSYFGTFTVVDSSNPAQPMQCANAAHITAIHPALSGLTDASLSNWNCTSHNGFDSWPSAFMPLAIITDATLAPYTAPDGTQGLAYLLARGDALAPGPTFTPTFTPTETPTPTQTPTPTWTGTPTPTPTPPCPVELFPVPFQPSTAVRGTLKAHCLPEGSLLCFYTLSGELVRKVWSSNGKAEWDGTNDSGRQVASGAFLYVVEWRGKPYKRGKLIILSP